MPTNDELEKDVQETSVDVQDNVDEEREDDVNEDESPKLAKVRKEAARRRIAINELKAKLAELEPLAEKYREIEKANQTDAEKAEARIRELETALQERERAIAVANQKMRISSLASKAGLPAELVEWLDLSKFDFDDDDAGLAKQLAALAKVAKPNPSTGSANPGRGAGESDEEMRQILFGRRKSIFD